MLSCITLTLAAAGEAMGMQSGHGVCKLLVSGVKQSLQSCTSRALLQCSVNLSCSHVAIQVPEVVDLAHIVPILVSLSAWDGIVSLVVARAKAVDPQDLALQQTEAGNHARTVSCSWGWC